MKLCAFDKVVIDRPMDETIRGLVIGIKAENNHTTTYLIEPRRKDYGRFRNGARLLKVNSTEIDNGTINLKIHRV